MEFSLSEFVLTVISGCCAVIGLLSFLSWWLSRQNENHALQQRVICRLCLHAYEQTRDGELSQCPNCLTHNERQPGA